MPADDALDRVAVCPIQVRGASERVPYVQTHLLALRACIGELVEPAGLVRLNARVYHCVSRINHDRATPTRGDSGHPRLPAEETSQQFDTGLG